MKARVRKTEKARLKATGEIVEVEEYHKYLETGWKYRNINTGTLYKPSALDFSDEAVIDYWTRLEHQYAGMAMQGLVTRGEVLGATKQEIAIEIADISDIIAHALIQKLKEKEERK